MRHKNNKYDHEKLCLAVYLPLYTAGISPTAVCSSACFKTGDLCKK